MRAALLAILVLTAGCEEDLGLCGACGDGEVCVQFFDGPCGVFRTECQARVATCTGTACTDACDQAHCKGLDANLTCHSGGCPDENPAAIHCYGP